MELVRLKGKHGKPKFFGEYWSIEFLYPPVIRVVFTIHNIPGRDYSICKVSIWDFYGKSKFQKKLLGEHLIDEELPKIESKKEGVKVFKLCKENHRDSILEFIEDTIANAEGYTKWKWDKNEQAWFRLRIVNGKVISRERVDKA